MKSINKRLELLEKRVYPDNTAPGTIILSFEDRLEIVDAMISGDWGTLEKKYPKGFIDDLKEWAEKDEGSTLG